MRRTIFQSLILSGSVLLKRVLADCPQGPGSEAAACCWSSWQEWDSSSRSYETVITTVLTTKHVGSMIEDTDVPITTLCDGIPRALEPYTTRYTTSLVTTDPYTTYISSTYTEPSPTCNINEDDCKPYADAWDSAYSSWSQNKSLPYPTNKPHCVPYLPCPTESQCKIYAGGDATIYYWPVTVAGPDGGLCESPRTTLNPTPTDPPVTTVLSGTTFTSPSIYVSLAHVSAAKHRGQYNQTPCGHAHHDVVLTLHPSDVSTQRGKPGGRTNTFAIDLRDLNTPVPYSAYLGQPSCLHTTNCPTIGMDDYHPQMAKPTQLTGVDPDFEKCQPRSERLGATLVPLGMATPAVAEARETGFVRVVKRAGD
ncbi:hypothetical protein P152DRAFT_471139 [Eremomyces bilateralis CBS 781.70]|uniref:Uncharacterized protein n=1 Tax=Eremomyces bilateralis CBS 781.70 TaxID=1392243 RepID=A0A6G1GCW0_9PEZI|nr:uncharacterized protein P152DRAFT_471139 [Eremomyces bilateralis CBS 781.70]KAF1815740.1 hypothetical protein P152DRAFT_471139 [Eremomyces bilateralis CBS 781.70]